MQNKYYFLKRLYPEYVIMIRDNNRKYVTFGNDIYLEKYIKYKDINYIKFDMDLNVIRKFEVEDNKYNDYLVKVMVEQIVDKYMG